VYRPSSVLKLVATITAATDRIASTDCLIVFARWRPYVPYLTHCSLYPR